MSEEVVHDDLGEEIMPVNPTKRYVIQDLATLSKIFDIITTNYPFYGSRLCSFDSFTLVKTQKALFNRYDGMPVIEVNIGDTIIVSDANITKEEQQQ